MFGVKRKSKVFCIGFNKTGTTSLEQVFRDMGWRVGKQKTAELMLNDWARRDFRSLFKYCKSADFFQDVPFSLPYTYEAVDVAFPGSKFILTVRDSGDQWFDSLVRFHKKLFGLSDNPSEQELSVVKYHYSGWLLQALRSIYGDESGFYDRDVYIDVYERHNKAVLEYFRYRPDDLLVLNVSAEHAYSELMGFLGLPDGGGSFPWLNKS